MSLLVINSANRISQGLVKSLQQSNKYERILCADIYPSYSVNQKWFKFLEDLSPSSKTKVSDMKIEERSDLVRAIRSSSHVLYVTHDYYQLVFSKLTMVVNAAKIVHQSPNVKKLVFVNPIEHYHYGEGAAFETHAKAEEDARKVHQNSVTIQSDLVFGRYSTAVHQLICRISNGKKVHFSPSKNLVAPIHCDNLAELVQQALEGNITENVVAKGAESMQWPEIMNILENAIGARAQVVDGGWDSPLKNNLLSETLHEPCYRNLTQFLKNYETPRGETKAVANLKSFKQTYGENSLKKEDFLKKSDNVECGVKWLFG